MSHHAPDMSPEQRRHFEKFLHDTVSEPMNLGPTGAFPAGKVHPTDEGEIKLAVGHGNGKVFVHFGKPTTWLGFDRAQALALAQSLIEHAAQVE